MVDDYVQLHQIRMFPICIALEMVKWNTGIQNDFNSRLQDNEETWNLCSSGRPIELLLWDSFDTISSILESRGWRSRGEKWIRVVDINKQCRWRKSHRGQDESPECYFILRNWRIQHLTAVGDMSHTVLTITDGSGQAISITFPEVKIAQVDVHMRRYSLSLSMRLERLVYTCLSAIRNSEQFVTHILRDLMRSRAVPSYKITYHVE